MKRFIYIALVLGAFAFSGTDTPIGSYPLYIGNVNSNGSFPAMWVLGGRPTNNNGNYATMRFRFTDIMNLSYITGNLPISRITDLQATLNSKQAAGDYVTTTALTTGLNTKQNTLTGSNLLATINGMNLFYGDTITIPTSGGTSLDTASVAFKKSIAQVARDSAQTQTLPFAPKFFTVLNNQVYPKGGTTSPTPVQVAGNAVVSFQIGSTDYDGVMIVTVTSPYGVTPGLEIGGVSFGQPYGAGPSIQITAEQFFPRTILKTVGAGGYYLASGETGTMQTGTFKFHYHVLPI